MSLNYGAFRATLIQNVPVGWIRFAPIRQLAKNELDFRRPLLTVLNDWATLAWKAAGVLLRAEGRCAMVDRRKLVDVSDCVQAASEAVSRSLRQLEDFSANDLVIHQQAIEQRLLIEESQQLLARLNRVLAPSCL